MIEKKESPSTAMPMLFALSLAGYPFLAAFSGAASLDNRAISIVFRAMFLALSMFIIYTGYRKHVLVHRGVFWFFYISFWSMYAFRLVHDLFIADVPSAYEPELYIAFLFGVTIIPSFAFAFPLDERAAKRALKFSLILLVATQFVFFFSPDNFSLETTIEFQRAQTDQLNAITLGAVGGLTVNFATISLMYSTIGLGVQTQSRAVLSTALYKFSCIMAIAIGFTTIFLSGSRGPLLATLVCYACIFYAAYRKATSRVASGVLFSLITMSIGMLVLPFVVDLGAPILERLAATTRGEEMSDSGRFLLWENGLAQALESPIFGSGFEEKEVVFYVHNLLLEAFMSTGFIGALIWIALFFIGLKRALIIILEKPAHGWIAVTFLYTFVYSFLSGNLWNAGSLAYFLVALYGIPLATTAPKPFDLQTTVQRNT